MARAVKWILGIIAGVVVLCIIGIVILLSSYDFNNFKPVISKAVYDATGRELSIGSNIDLKIGLSPSLVLSDITFQNANWGSRKEMVKINRFEVKVALLPLIKGNINVKRFILQDPDILIETNKNGKTNLEFKKSEKPPATENKPAATGKEEVKLPALTINELEIVNGTLTYRDDRTGKAETVTLKKLTAGIQGLENPITFDLSGAYKDEPFEMSGTLGSIKSFNNPEVEWPVDVSAKAFGTSTSIKGIIKNPMEQKGIDIDFSAKIDDWNKLAKIAGQKIPIKDALSVSGNIVDSAPKNYQISGLKISLGKNQIDGSIGMNLAGKIPFIDAALSSKELDLKSLMPENKTSEKSAEKTENKKNTSKENEKIFSTDPLPLDSLKLVDGRFKIRFDKIIMPQVVIDNLAFDTTMNNGNLTVKPFKADMGGGSVSLEMELLSKGNTADLSTVVNVKDLEISDMLKEAGSNESLEGNINADVDIKGHGDSVASIMAGLNGFTRVIMSEGKIDNKIIDKLGGDVSKNILRLLNPSIDNKQYTALKCMVVRFDIVDGIADATAFAIDTSMMSVVGEGNINLKTETLDLSLAPSTKAGVAGYNLNIGELAQPFKLGGTLAKPSLALDKQKTALALGKIIGEKFLSKSSGNSASPSTKGEEVDVCAAALQAAKTGVKMTVGKSSSAKEESKQATPQKLLEDVIKNPKKALKDLFGK